MTAMLALWLITNIAQGLYYLNLALTTSPRISTINLIWVVLRTAANVIFLVAIWNWKKWGAYGVAASPFLGAFIILIMGGTSGTFIGALVGAILVSGILYFLLRNVWNLMD